MFYRMQYYDNLKSYVRLLDKKEDEAMEAGNDGCIRQALMAARKCFPDIVATESERKVDVHNELARRLYLRAHRSVIHLLENVDFNAISLETNLNLRLKVCSILNDHAVKILDYSSVQLKFFDSLMGKLRRSDNPEFVEFVHSIDKELEIIK